MKPLVNIRFDFDGEDTSYLTHSLHPYPAKFPPQLPKTILKEFARPGQNVLDPFCGSGTTLVEARIQGIHSTGVDINGLACLISQVKATPLNESQLTLLKQTIQSFTREFSNWQVGNRPPQELPTFNGLAHWFQNNVAQELAFLKSLIWEIRDSEIRALFKVAFASIIVRVSNQESDTRFAAIEKNIPDGFALGLFRERIIEFQKKIQAFSAAHNGPLANLHVYNADARQLDFLGAASFDLVITSPPYANTYDYYLYHKFRKYWLELDVQFAQYNEIGSRREFSSLKKDPQKWTNDLRQCFNEMARVLRPRGLAFIVIGDSVIQKRLIQMADVVAEIAKVTGFEVCDVVSSDLERHSRMFNPSFTQRGKREHLIMLEKKNA